MQWLLGLDNALIAIEIYITKLNTAVFFFNEGAIRSEQSKQLKRFRQINKNGEIDDIPSQQGYCFVFNHYDGTTKNGNLKKHRYRANITKWFAGGKQTHQIVSRTFTQASEDWSSDLPDLCVTGLRNVHKVAIAFKSDDPTHFDWNITFAIK